MNCPRCHAENREGRRFCGECGLSFAATCASCGFVNEGSEKFCGGCGRSLTAQFSPPESYTPKHLAEKILTSRVAIEGERKQVTVLFADMKGSMELLAGRDPEEARRILDPVLGRMMDAVHRYEGTVNQVMGDGIMALFGAPIAHEDHAVRACHAALDMQRAVKRHVADVGDRTIRIRIGLNSGEVLVRSIGSDLRMDYSAVGQTTHLAARLEQMAEPGTILLSAATQRLAEGHVEVTRRRGVAIKGLTEAVDVYELQAATDRTRLDVAAERGLSPFVGRDAEVGQLRRALRQAGDGHGQVVGIVGEPGVGKSRLLREFTSAPDAREWRIVQSGAVSYGKTTSYLPIAGLLRACFNVRDREEHQVIRGRVAGDLRTLDLALETMLPAVLTLLDVPVEDAEWKNLDPRQRRQRMHDAVRRLLLRLSEVEPLMLVLEDLHWSDSETRTLLDTLVESLPAARVLLLVTYRPEYEDVWNRKTYYTQVRVDPLPSENVDDLLRRLLGDHPTLPPVKRLLIQRTEGNPFFMEETVRSLIEDGALSGEAGGYRLAKGLAAVQVPPTVHAVLAARIDRLPPDDKRALQCASVIGKDVPVGLLEAIAGTEAQMLSGELARLRAAEFMYEAPASAGARYTFKHALTQDVAYATLTLDRRRELHRGIVETIEAEDADRLGEQVERLGYHALRAEAWEKAVAYLPRAGEKAAGRSAYREAVACFEDALLAFGHLPDRGARVAEEIDLRLRLRGVLFPLGDLPAMFEQNREAERLAGLLGDERRSGRIAAQMANDFFFIGDYARSIELAEQARAIAASLGELQAEVTARYYLGIAHHCLGAYARAASFFRANVDGLRGAPEQRRATPTGFPAVYNRVHLGRCLTEIGEFGEGLASADEGVEIAEETGGPIHRSIALAFAGFAHLRKGNVERAVALLEPCLVLCEGDTNPIVFPMAASHLGYAYAHLGRIGEALPLLERAVEQSASMGRMDSQSLRIVMRGEGYLIAGRRADAAQSAEDALALARRLNERGHEAYALRLLGDVAACGDPSDVERADARYRDALTLAAELGMRPLVAHCHVGLGKLYDRMGKRQQAQEHLTTAVTMFREMGMTYWLENGFN